MRLVFANLNHSSAYGGVERWMLDAAVGLRARGHEVLLLGRPRAPWLAAGAGLGLAVRDDHNGVWALRLLRTRAALRRARSDVVVVKGKKLARMAAWARATGAGGRVALFFGLTHELSPARWIDRRTWSQVDAGIAVAHEAADWYAAAGFGPREKLHVLWKGVDLARFDAAHAERARVRAELGVGPGTLLVGTVGRLAWQKGLDRLFAAMQAALPQLEDACLVVVGAGREAPEIAAASATLGDRVRFLGQRDDVPALLAAMDVVVLASRREVMAQTTLEAMAAGRPVVSTRTAGAAEAIDDGTSGVLVPVGDDAALASALVALARDPARREALGAAARARVARDFTLERMLDRCEAILQTIAAPAAAHSPLARER